MGTWQSLQVAFLVGSLFMILLIIVYWDDVGGFSPYPLQDPKYEPPIVQSTLLSVHTASPTGGLHSPLHPPGGALTPLDSQNPAGERVEENGREEEEEEQGGRIVGDGGQEERKRRITRVCSEEGSFDFPGKMRTFDQIPNRELDHLIVDDTHQIIYCYVPKVACTNWKRVMVVLSQSLVSPSSGKPFTDPEAIPADLVHNASLHFTFAKFWRHYGSLSRHLMALKLQHYTKFLFVRDPFVRLISAFRNKFARPNEDFYRMFGSVMLRRYGNLSENVPETVAEAFAAGIRPTFQQFITYLLDPETEREAVFNEHWRQVYRLCHPCQVQYDFIGQLESLDKDSEQLLRILGVDHWLHFPTGARNRTAASWERDWFTQIPLAMRKDLYQLYEPDFKLFGYPEPDSFLHQ